MEPIIEFVTKNDVRSLQEAITRGANPDERDSDGRTALIHASIDNKLEVAMALLDAGADVNAQDGLGNSALHYAAQEYHSEMALLLLSRGKANVDVRDVHGNTPLWRAVFNSHGRGNMISILLGAGANRNHQNVRGKSPLELAKTIANYDIEQFFHAGSTEEGG